MGCPEENSVQALVDHFLDQSWKLRLAAIVDEEEAKTQEALDEHDEELRLQTDLFRGKEQQVETQIDQMRSILDEQDRGLEEDRLTLERLRKSMADKSALALQLETEKSRLDQCSQELSERALSTAELEKKFPNELFRQKLFFNMTRIVFGKVKKNRVHSLRGYISNANATDVTPFEIDTLTTDSGRVRDYLWDYVADGISEEFKQEIRKI